MPGRTSISAKLKRSGHTGTTVAGVNGVNGVNGVKGVTGQAHANGVTPAPQRDAAGYRPRPGQGPLVRTDVVDVYIARRGEDLQLELLQIQRAKSPLLGTWQPVMGHIEAGETALQAAVREMGEEVGLMLPATAAHTRAEPAADDGPQGLWALEQVHPFYIAAIDCVVLSPRFVALVGPQWTPRLNDEHTAWRWSRLATAHRTFMWPGQLAAVREIGDLLDRHGPARVALRVWPAA